MTSENVSADGYPGEAATAVQMLQLADAYSESARVLAAHLKGKAPVSRAPFRFTAVHAIELYQNAFLLHAGHKPQLVRGLQHDLAKRISLVLEGGLLLRGRTVKHLNGLAEAREYLKTRYGAESFTTGAEVTRITATLMELGSKVSSRVSRPTPRAEPACG